MTLVLSPTTSLPGGNVTASGTADRKIGSSLSCRLVAEGIVLASFTVPPNNKYSVSFRAPIGANRTVSITLQQPNNSNEWATTATANLAILSTAPPPPTFPGVPLSLAGTAANTTVALTWSAPTSDGGSAITGYRVYRGGSLIASPSGTTYTVTGLTVATAYQFSVAAANAIGTGPQTAQITVTTTNGDTVPPMISNVSVSSITQTGCTISWVLNEPGTGQVQYGTVASGGYASLSTLESSYLSAHVQTLTGLVAGTAYHFLVKSADATGNMGTSSEQFFNTTAVAPPPPPPTGYPADRAALQYAPVPTVARPGYLATITDPTWGTKVTRISNVHLRRNAYASVQCWNSDGTRMILNHDPGSNWRVLNGTTYVDLGALSTGVDYCQWSHTNPALLYGVQWNIGVRTNTGVPGAAWQTIRTFPGYGYMEWGGYNGNLSDDDHLMGINMWTGSAELSGTARVVMYDPVSDVVRGILDTGTNRPMEANVSPSGQYVQITWGVDGSAMYQGTWLYALPAIDGGSLTPVRLLRPDRIHNTMAKDAAGNDIWCNSQGRIVSMSGATTWMFGGLNNTAETPQSGGGGHISATNIKRPGWVYLSTGVASPYPGHEQVYAIKTDGSGVVEVFGFAHACAVRSPASYDATPYFSPNPDGTKGVWGSAWDGSESSEVYAFVTTA